VLTGSPKQPPHCQSGRSEDRRLNARAPPKPRDWAENYAPRLFTRAEVLAILKIGETTLFWLQRTGKLKPIRIGSRVLFNAAEIERVAAMGATLTEAEKEAAVKRDRGTIASIQRGRPQVPSSTSPEPRRRRGPPDAQGAAP
jgi:hypothetical protein